MSFPHSTLAAILTSHQAVLSYHDFSPFSWRVCIYLQMSEIRPFSTNSTISRTHRPSDPPQPISKPSIHTSQAITHSEPHSNPLPIDYSLTPEDADYLVKAAIDATIDSYGRPKELTYNTFRLMDKALCINNPDSFTLRGIRFSHGRGEAYKCFREAEHKGSTHPLTYFFLAKLSRGADTLYYYDKCIEGTYSLITLL